jgi:hypothetical protein
LIRIPLLHHRDRELEPHIGAARVQLDGMLPYRNRVVAPSDLACNPSQAAQSIGLSRVGGKDLPVERLGRLKLAAPVARDRFIEKLLKRLCVCGAHRVIRVTGGQLLASDRSKLVFARHAAAPVAARTLQRE